MSTITEVDFALCGTGLAPLLAARSILSSGLGSVAIINPDFDFFREDSELALTPFPEVGISAEASCEMLRPHFPGSLSLSSQTSISNTTHAHDAFSPHVHSRTWLAVSRDEQAIQKLGAACQNLRLQTQSLKGISALQRFPGMSRARSIEDSEHFHGILVQRMGDIDITRYRNGILEFLQERLEDVHIFNQAHPIDFQEDQLRFHSTTGPHTIRVKSGFICFWTPITWQRYSSWLKNSIAHPKGLTYWEEWKLLSREPIDPHCLGVWDNMLVWASFEGPFPNPQTNPLYELNVLKRSQAPTPENSFSELNQLCHDFLGWSKYSIRNLKKRTILNWPLHVTTQSLTLGSIKKGIGVPKSDGPINEIVSSVQSALQTIGVHSEF